MSYDFSALDQVTRTWFNVKPKIKLDLRETNQGYEISVISKYSIDETGLDHIKVINWVEKQLNNIVGVQRTSYNNWIFDHREDVDKFVTFFYLKDPVNERL